MSTRIQRLLDPSHVKIAVNFLRLYIALKTDGHLHSLNLTGDIKTDYDKVATSRKLGYPSYKDLPRDAKAFISRCAGLRNRKPVRAFSFIIMTEYERVVHNHERLHREIMEELHLHDKLVHDRLVDRWFYDFSLDRDMQHVLQEDTPILIEFEDRERRKKESHLRTKHSHRKIRTNAQL